MKLFTFEPAEVDSKPSVFYINLDCVAYLEEWRGSDTPGHRWFMSMVNNQGFFISKDAFERLKRALQ